MKAGKKTDTSDVNLSLARNYVKLNAPYYTSTLYGFIPTPIEDLTALVGGPLAVTERLVLFYEPKWVETVSVKMLASGLAHEIMHHQLSHVARGKVYLDQERFNWAGDLVINQLLRKQQRSVKIPGGTGTQVVPLWELGPGWLLPERFELPEGLTANQYYDLLLGKKRPAPAFACGCCGGIAGNTKNKVLEDLHNSTRGRSTADCVNIARTTAHQIRQKMEGEGRGALAGAWDEFVQMSEDKFNIPWRKELPNTLRSDIGHIRSGGYDYSMRRPSPRSYTRGWPLPGLVTYDPEVAFVLDSSGSMGQEQLAEAQRIFSDVLVQTGITHAWFLEADSGVQRAPQRVRSRDLKSMTVHGRGGTSFIPAIELFDKRNTPGVRVPKINLLVYATDGDGDAPPVAPKGFRVIWCIVRSSWSRKAAPWGKTIFLDDLMKNLPKELGSQLKIPRFAFSQP